MEGGLHTVGYIANHVGCARATAVTYLDMMKEAGLVERHPVDDGQLYVWKVVEKKWTTTSNYEGGNAFHLIFQCESPYTFVYTYSQVYGILSFQCK